MILQRVNDDILVIRNNNWSTDWISPAFFVFLSALWHVLFFPIIFEVDEQFVYWFTHGIVAVLMLLNWPITESVTLNKVEKTVLMKRKLLIKSTQYKTTLEGVKDVTTEQYKKRIRMTLSFHDGMCFPLSTNFFPSKLIEDSIYNEVREFLGFKRKQRKDILKANNTAAENPTNSENSPAEPDSDSGDSESDIDPNDPNYDSDGEVNWDKAIDDWEKDVKERKTIRS